MSPGPAASPPLTVVGVLRATLALVRRRALLYAVLAVSLSILPDLVVDWAVDLDDPVLQDGSFEDLLAATIDGLEGVGPVLLWILLDVAVLSLALRDAAASSGPAPGLVGTGRRLLPLALAAAALAVGWTALDPGRALDVGLSLISCWVLAAPVCAERPRRVAWPRRLAALVRGHRRAVAALAALCVAADFFAAKLAARLPDLFGSDTAAGRAAEVVGSSAQALVIVLAAALAAALYAALRRAENPDPAALAAFE